MSEKYINNIPAGVLSQQEDSEQLLLALIFYSISLKVLKKLKDKQCII